MSAVLGSLLLLLQTAGITAPHQSGQAQEASCQCCTCGQACAVPTPASPAPSAPVTPAIQQATGQAEKLLLVRTTIAEQPTVSKAGPILRPLVLSEPERPPLYQRHCALLL